ncbi:hypothetical protein D9M72_249880 [compost metagenome]
MGQRQRKQPALGRLHRDGRGPRTRAFGQALAHGGGALGEPRVLEHQAHRKVDVPVVRHAGRDLRGGERTATAGEEMGVARERLRIGGPEHFAPDRIDDALGLVEHGRFDLFLDRAAFDEHTALVDGIRIRAAIEPARAARAALQLAAGGLGHAARVEQQHGRQRFAEHLADRGAQRLDQHLRRHQLLHAARHLGRRADAFTVGPVGGEHRHAPLAHRIDLGLDDALDVLRIDVVAAHDDQVLDAARDVELAVADEAQVAGAQPAAARALDEGLGRFARLAPVASADARAVHPDFADATGLGHHRQRGGIDDLDHMRDRHRTATDQQRAAFARRAHAAGQAVGAEAARDHAGAAPAASHEQGRLGEAVAGVDRARIEARGGEALDEVELGVGAHRLGAGVGHAPAREVELRDLRVLHALQAEAEREVRPAAERGAVARDQLQPAHRALEEIARRGQHQWDAAVQRLHQAADEAHVVIQRRPRDELVVGPDAHADLDGMLVGHQVAVRHDDALGRRGRARGVLQKGNVVVGRLEGLPGVGECDIDRVDGNDLHIAELVAGRRHRGAQGRRREHAARL